MNKFMDLLKETSNEYHPDDILETLALPNDWEYIWIPKELPEGYSIIPPSKIDTKTDIYEKPITTITMNFLGLIPNSSEKDGTLSGTYTFRLPGDNGYDWSTPGSYKDRNQFTRPNAFYDDASVETSWDRQPEFKYFDFIQYKGAPSALYSDYINSSTKYKEGVYYFSEIENETILYWIQDGYTLCPIGDMNKDQLEQLANTIITSISF